MRLLQLALAVIYGMARSILADVHFVAVAEPAAWLAMAALAGATAQDTAAASAIVTTCTRLGRALMILQLSGGVSAVQSGSDSTGQGGADSSWVHHMRQLLSSLHYAQMMLVNLAACTKGVLQALPPADGAGSGSSSGLGSGSGSSSGLGSGSSSSYGDGDSPSSSSSSSSSSTLTCPRKHADAAQLPAAQGAASPAASATLPHEHLWQRLGLAPALLPMVAEAERTDADPGDFYLNFQLAAMQRLMLWNKRCCQVLS
jgi:predicted small lipoprotein YifL